MPDSVADRFPALPYADWVETKETLHLFLQMVGKIRLKTHPKLNHWWHVTLYPSVRGLTTGWIPRGAGGFEILFDMVDHQVVVTRDGGDQRRFAVPGLSVAGFHDALFAALSELGLTVRIVGVPYENKSTVPFAEDRQERRYDPQAVERYWRALCTIASVFETWRGRFTGKQTPVHLFWHSFDLVTTRFSGRAHPLENARTQSDREAYSHEVISAGFWPGDDAFPEPAFYGYAYPEPAGLAATRLAPAQAAWAEKNGGALAVYRYDDLRTSDDPDRDLLAFLESVYRAAGEQAGWPLAEFEHAFASR